MGGYGSHCTKEFIDFCDDHKIIPLCLPPHTTHLLQPLDVVVFQPYKHYHAEAIDEATRTGCTDFSKLEFLSAITAIRKKTFKYTTILSAFRQTGLIPFNPEIVLDELNADSESELEPPYTPRAVTPGPSEPPTIPLTIRSLKRRADQLEATPLEDRSTSTFQQKLHAFVAGSLAQAQSGAQMAEELEHTEAAEKARKDRKSVV